MLANWISDHFAICCVFTFNFLSTRICKVFSDPLKYFYCLNIWLRIFLKALAPQYPKMTPAHWQKLLNKPHLCSGGSSLWFGCSRFDFAAPSIFILRHFIRDIAYLLAASPERRHAFWQVNVRTNAGGLFYGGKRGAGGWGGGGDRNADRCLSKCHFFVCPLQWTLWCLYACVCVLSGRTQVKMAEGSRDQGSVGTTDPEEDSPNMIVYRKVRPTVRAPYVGNKSGMQSLRGNDP